MFLTEQQNWHFSQTCLWIYLCIQAEILEETLGTLVNKHLGLTILFRVLGQKAEWERCEFIGNTKILPNDRVCGLGERFYTCHSQWCKADHKLYYKTPLP